MWAGWEGLPQCPGHACPVIGCGSFPSRSCTLSSHSRSPQDALKRSWKHLACPERPEQVRTCEPLDQRAC